MIKPTDVLDTAVSVEVVCTWKPVGVSDAAAFVDTTELHYSDDMGGWIHKAKPVQYYDA